MPSHKSTVDIKSGWLFPFQFLVLGFVFLIAGIVVVVPHPIIGIVLVLAGAVILTAHEGTEIIPAAQSYREYNSILFIKSGKGKRYTSMEKIFINPVKVRQTMYTAHTLQSSSFSNLEYNAYLKFSDGVKVFLLAGKNKRKVINKLQGIADTLNIPLQDNAPGR
ncbi:MAG: hypothetical protein WA874_09855 [Chryseosolibacter sp.]